MVGRLGDTPAGGSACRSPFAGAIRMLLRPRDGWRSRMTSQQINPPHPPALQPFQDLPPSRRVANSRNNP